MAEQLFPVDVVAWHRESCIFVAEDTLGGDGHLQNMVFFISH